MENAATVERSASEVSLESDQVECNPHSAGSEAKRGVLAKPTTWVSETTAATLRLAFTHRTTSETAADAAHLKRLLVPLVAHGKRGRY